MKPKLRRGIVSVAGVDVGANGFHAIGRDALGAIALRPRPARGQIEPRLANSP